MQGLRVSTRGRRSDGTQPKQAQASPASCLRPSWPHGPAQHSHDCLPDGVLLPISGVMVKPLEYVWHIGECKNNNKITSLT